MSNDNPISRLDRSRFTDWNTFRGSSNAEVRAMSARFEVAHARLDRDARLADEARRERMRGN